MGIVDTRLPQTIIDVSQIAMYTFCVIAVVGYQNPFFLIAAFLLSVVAYYLRLFYVRTSRSIKRLEGISEYFYSYSSIINSKLIYITMY